MIIFRKNIPKKYVFIVALLLLVGVAVGLGLSNGKKQELFTVTRSDLIQEVSVTGTTKAEMEVELGFDISGRVSRSFAKVGDRVTAGATIAELDTSTELATLARERSLLVEAEANVGQNSEKLASLIREGYRAADNAVRNKTDQFFKTPRTNPNFEVKFSDGNFVHYFNVPSSVAIDLNSERKTIESVLTLWQGELSLVNEATARKYASLATNRLSQISDVLGAIAYAVNEFTPSEFAYEATVEGYKTDINSARAEVSTAEEAIIAASSDNASSAKINQIQASIAALEAELGKSKIRAPFAGTVTRQDAKPGQIASASTPLVEIISDKDMYIEANVSEINIGKVQVGNIVWASFDAFPGELTQGLIAYIEPGETIVDGVVYYKIRVDLQGNFDSRMKSGLTANLKIETARKDYVLTVPQYAITERGGQVYTTIIGADGKTKEIKVETGLVGSDGKVEILSGLNEGDNVILE